MFIRILKIVLHETKPMETVHIFTNVKFPDNTGYLSFQVSVPPGQGPMWIYNELKTANFETLPEEFEVVAPG
jgi:hypothetical protein